MPLNVRPGGSGSKERQMYLENEHGITIEVNVDVNVDYLIILWAELDKFH